MKQPDVRLIRFHKLLGNYDWSNQEMLESALEKLKFLKAAAKSNDIPSLPESLQQVIDEIEAALKLEISHVHQEYIPLPLSGFLNLLPWRFVMLQFRITTFKNKPPRFVVEKVSFLKKKP